MIDDDSSSAPTFYRPLDRAHLAGVTILVSGRAVRVRLYARRSGNWIQACSLALGATARDVVRLVPRTTLRPVAAGASMGVIVAMIVARLIAHLLMGVSALDPIAVAASIAVLSLATTLACYAPLRQALGIGPMTALRCD